MCDTREKIVEDYYVLQQAEKRLEKLGLVNGKGSDPEALEQARTEELILFLGKESFINAKQANQNAGETAKKVERHHRKYPSIAYMAAKMPLVLFPLLMAFVLIIIRLSDPTELVWLASFLGMKLTAEGIRESSFIVFLGLIGVSGAALSKYKNNLEKEQKK